MKRFLCACLLFWTALCAHALTAEDLLPPERAFALSASRSGDVVRLDWAIADGYYLYRDRISIRTEPPADIRPELPPGQLKHDPFFGETPVWRQAVEGEVRLPADTPSPVQLVITQQGCADAGVCYPPQTIRLSLAADGRTVSAGSPAAGFLSAPPAATSPASQPASDGSGLGSLGCGALTASFFVAGLGMALTACLYPMLPIVSAIIAGHGTAAHGWRGLLLALAYVEGLALTYTVVGVAAGLTGSWLTVWLQRPEVAVLAAVMLVLLALAMFDIISVQLPAGFQARMASSSNRLTGGRLASVFGMGALSALIIGPCVAPPLAVALGYIGASGDALTGGVALFAMAQGLGAPLLLVGAAGGQLLPKAGPWMKAVKAVFGVGMLLLAVYLLAPYLPPALPLAAYGIILIVSAVFAGAFDSMPAGSHPGRRLLKSLGLLAALLGAVQLVGSLAGADDPRYPLAPLTARADSPATAAPAFTSVSSLAEWESFLAANRGRPVLLDFYADWCASCKEMERETFHDPAVVQAMRGMALAQADVTANTPAHQALLKHFGLFGPPGIILFSAQGQESGRVIGFMPPAAFLQEISAVTPSVPQ